MRNSGKYRKLIERLNAIYRRYRKAIQQASRETGVPESVIVAVIYQESGGNPRAVSRAGAMGLMQLMPRTARALGISNPFDPMQNIMGGTRYLKTQYDRYGRWDLAFAAYNAGPARVKKGQIPNIPETQRFVSNLKFILTHYDPHIETGSSYEVSSVSSVPVQEQSRQSPSEQPSRQRFNPWKEMFKQLLLASPMLPENMPPRTDNVQSEPVIGSIETPTTLSVLPFRPLDESGQE